MKACVTGGEVSPGCDASLSVPEAPALPHIALTGLLFGAAVESFPGLLRVIKG